MYSQTLEIRQYKFNKIDNYFKVLTLLYLS